MTMMVACLARHATGGWYDIHQWGYIHHMATTVHILSWVRTYNWGGIFGPKELYHEIHSG